jgi:hypothetical protein
MGGFLYRMFEVTAELQCLFLNFCSIKDVSIVIKIETVFFSYVIVIFTKLP